MALGQVGDKQIPRREEMREGTASRLKEEDVFPCSVTTVYLPLIYWTLQGAVLEEF